MTTVDLFLGGNINICLFGLSIFLWFWFKRERQRRTDQLRETRIKERCEGGNGV